MNKKNLNKEELNKNKVSGANPDTVSYEKNNNENLNVHKKDNEEIIKQKNEELIKRVTKLNDEKTVVLRQRGKMQAEIGIIVAIFMFLLFAVTFGIFIFFNQVPNISDDYIRVTFSKINKEIFLEESSSGEMIPKIISPGDSFNLVVETKNSNNPNGDKPEEVWGNIYLRFKVMLVIDGAEHTEFIEIYPETEYWHKYNKEEEDKILSAGRPVVSKDDGYYYFKGIVSKNQTVRLFNKLTFSGKNITEEVGGKRAELVIVIEALDAIENSITNRIYWTDAPQAWVNNITK